MKRPLLIVTLLLCAFSASAQQADEPLRSKQGQIILPEAGDFGLGFDAVPILEYLGNIFNGTQNNSIEADFPGISQQVFGKYFLADEMAIRARLRLQQDRFTNRNRVILDGQTTPDPGVQVTDEWIESRTDGQIGGGIEWRKGKGRVVGVFGGEVSFLYRRTKIKYDYGNEFTENNQVPTSTFGGFTGGQFERIKEEMFDKEMGFGITGFAGIEYYVAPKMSLGAEFTLGFDFINTDKAKDTFEYWDGTSSSVQTRSAVEAGGNSVSLRTANYGGSINLLFYF